MMDFFTWPVLLLIFSFIILLREHHLRKRAEQELRTFKKEKIVELVGKGKLSELRLMAAGIAHEISNPLMIITGNVQRMRRNADPESQLQLEKISKSAERISKIIQGLRTYTLRNEEDPDKLISFKEMVEEVLLFFGQRLKNHGVVLRLLNLDGIYVKGHRGQIEQAILSLLSHSFEAVDHQDEKWIEINADKFRDRILVNVSYSGPPISRDIWTRMSEPFYADQNGKSSLSIARSIAEENDGKLEFLDDEVNPTFLLELPRAKAVNISQ